MTATPNTAALHDLLDRVEAGEASTMGFEDAGFDGWAELAYHGSLDAAKALHDAVLPGCNQYTVDEGPSGCGAKIVIWPNGLSHGPELMFNGYDVTPSRAWLGAIIRALLAAPVTENEGGV